MIQRYHVYKDIVMPTIRKILQSGREPDNSYDSFGVAIIENYIIILSLDMCLGILLVRIPHHMLNEESKWIYRKLQGCLFSRFTKYPRNFLSSKIIRPTVHTHTYIHTYIMYICMYILVSHGQTLYSRRALSIRDDKNPCEKALK